MSEWMGLGAGGFSADSLKGWLRIPHDRPVKSRQGFRWFWARRSETTYWRGFVACVRDGSHS